MKDILNCPLFFEDLIYLIKNSEKFLNKDFPNHIGVKIPREKFVTNFTDIEIKQAIPEISEFTSSIVKENGFYGLANILNSVSFNDDFLLIMCSKVYIDYLQMVDYDISKFIKKFNLLKTK